MKLKIIKKRIRKAMFWKPIFRKMARQKEKTS
jgi:hypothetical protein